MAIEETCRVLEARFLLRCDQPAQNVMEVPLHRLRRGAAPWQGHCAILNQRCRTVDAAARPAAATGKWSCGACALTTFSSIVSRAMTKNILCVYYTMRERPRARALTSWTKLARRRNKNNGRRNHFLPNLKDRIPALF